MKLPYNFIFDCETGHLFFEKHDIITPCLPFELFTQTDWWQNYGVPLTAITMRGEETFLKKAMDRGDYDLFLRTCLSNLVNKTDVYIDFHFTDRTLASIRLHPKCNQPSSHLRFEKNGRLVLRWLNHHFKKMHRFRWKVYETYRYEHPIYTLLFRVDEEKSHWEVILVYREGNVRAMVD